MTMHLEGPWLSTTGRVRSVRRKFASADAAQKQRELEAEWLSRQQAWAKTLPRVPTRIAATRATLSPQYPPGREPNRVPSRPDTPGTVASRAADKVYTGTSVVGIVVQHKSCLQPVFSSDEAKDSAKMRR